MLLAACSEDFKILGDEYGRLIEKGFKISGCSFEGQQSLNHKMENHKRSIVAL